MVQEKIKMKFTKLNADVETQKNAIEGQGSMRNKLSPRGLQRDKAKNPNETSFDVITEKPALYSRVISPFDIEMSRVVVQVRVSQDPNVPLSSQLNQEINPSMENKRVKGGDRILI